MAAMAATSCGATEKENLLPLDKGERCQERKERKRKDGGIETINRAVL